ncbi:MAG: GNAT family N-acetyltransferase [Alphaproteobacteria bacterium]
MRLSTSRLVLRPFEDRDARAVIAWLNDPQVSRWLIRVPQPYRQSDFDWWTGLVNASHASGQAAHFAIAYRHTGQVIGGVSIADPGAGRDEFGYWLARPWWGQGLMVEAGRAVLAHGFAYLNAPAMVATVHPDNRRSSRVLEKLGFRPAEMRPLPRPNRYHLPMAPAWSLDRNHWRAS